MKSFRLADLAVFAAATVPRLAHRGMFVDGVTYASIARNLAEGRGSFWSPSYTATLYPQFHEHPPLGFWLQSLWFRVLGDHLFVERLYTAVVALATGVLIGLIWRRLDTDAASSGDHVVEDDGRGTAGYSARDDCGQAEGGQCGRNGLDWLPLVLWIAVPVVSWSIVGNLLETTVALFTTGAVLSALAAVADTSGESRRDNPASKVTAFDATTGWSVLSGFCIVAAGLTKGPVGLFPLVAPLAFLLLPRWASCLACARGAMDHGRRVRLALMDFGHRAGQPHRICESAGDGGAGWRTGGERLDGDRQDAAARRPAADGGRRSPGGRRGPPLRLAVAGRSNRERLRFFQWVWRGRCRSWPVPSRPDTTSCRPCRCLRSPSRWLSVRPSGRQYDRFGRRDGSVAR